jgi:hypothetical protein
MANVTTTKSQMQEYSLTSARSILDLANELSKFIKDRKLCMNIQGKEYVLIEAWTFAGMSMGLCPVVTELINESTGDEVKYRAVVELLNIHTNTVVGRGFAVCSNKEQGKQRFQEYAIASMAQTRATGKAYRLPLGFLMKAAGYEATPAEEMDFEVKATDKPKPAPEPTHEPATDKQKEQLVQLIQNPVFTDAEQARGLDKVDSYDKFSALVAIEQLTKAINQRKEKQAATAA